MCPLRQMMRRCDWHFNPNAFQAPEWLVDVGASQTMNGWPFYKLRVDGLLHRRLWQKGDRE